MMPLCEIRGRTLGLLLLGLALFFFAPETSAQRRHHRRHDEQPSPTMGQLMVVTEPAGASISVDTAAAGVAPVRLDNLNPGEHLVTATLNGASASQVAIVVAGRSQVLQLTLRPAGTVAPAANVSPPARPSAGPPPSPRPSAEVVNSQVSVAAPTIIGVDQQSPLVPTQGTERASRTTETAAETAVIYDWYRPSERDRQIPWNNRNGWSAGNDYPLSLSFGVHSLLSPYDATTPDATLIDATFRVGFNHFGVSLGVATLPNGAAPMFGFHFFRNGGWPLIDLRQPDLQFGLLWPTIEFRGGAYTRPIGTNDDSVLYFVYNGSLGISGIRVAWADFILFDIRPVISVWGIADRYSDDNVVKHFPVMGVSFDLSVNL